MGARCFLSGDRCIIRVHPISSPVDAFFPVTADLLGFVLSLKGERIMLLAVDS